MAQDDADDRGEFGVAYLRYVCDMATATEAPGQAVAVVQYALLVCVLFGLAGSLVMQASLK
jgi:hypothetical protein